MERTVLKGASLLIAISKPQVKLTETIHRKKVAVVPNGFDDADYQEDVPLVSRFTITYTGNIYPGKRDPTLLFEALSELRKEGKILPDDIQVRFFGGSSLKSLLPLTERYGLNDIVKIHGTVPFQESIRRQKESTILLLLEWNDPRAEGVYSGKIFEYLGAQRPILAIGYRAGVIGTLLSETGAGVLVDEVDTIKQVLRSWLKEWQKQGKITSCWKPVEDVIQKYTRREQTRKLARLLGEVSQVYHTERT